MGKYDANVGEVLSSNIIVDARENGVLINKVFVTEKAFFTFLNETNETDAITVEYIWKYTSGGILAEQDVDFTTGKLKLIPII